MLSPVPTSAAWPGSLDTGSHRLCWAGRERWDIGWEEQSIKSGICRFPAFPLLYLAQPCWAGGNICIANTSFAAKKKMFDGGGKVQGRTSQGLLQQQLGSPRAET